MIEWEHFVCFCVCTVYRRHFVVVVFDDVFRDCAIITWRRVGVFFFTWEIGGKGIGENNNKRDGGLDVKFNTYKGALIFHSFLQTGKVEELLEFKYK